ncbi:subtilisin family serine protease [Micromonospora pisi]|uniref:Subtilisin family serine protease n=1 Tax=Micromonospora pisi TaxID=589240 RepID=A0A495JH94_9ACTN|nr:S8 family serine peptidase [Micromonospora pisi]RKR87419.1 subtilisin family serine protease [Micromonospora pisi]
MFTSRRRIPRWAAGVAAALAAVLVLPAGAATAAPTSATVDPLRKVDPRLLQPLSAGASMSFFVELADELKLDEAELDRVERTAAGKAGRIARTTRVYQTKVSHAEQTQRGLRSLLRERKADFTPFWIANVIEVTGTLDLVTELAKRADVARIAPVGHTTLEEPTASSGATASATVPWNLSQIGADKVWNEYGVRGEGIVVGSIDTGVQYNHPALVRQYRGNTGKGTFSHDYNWFDPTNGCGATPCDNIGHGTHTVGTMVGDDGAGTVVGVAPGATWIAAKGCGDSFCEDPHLLAAGQWMLAPTDRFNQNPRPDLAPDIINNSWGGANDGENFYEQIIDTWLAAGIFPVYSVGNDGEKEWGPCNTAGYPAVNPGVYAVGAVDNTGTIAPFSSRGKDGDPTVRPDIAAPGVNIVSSRPGNEYGADNGTSMAAPHVAGAVALAWSAVPNLRRDVATTRELLDRTAHDVDDRQCGGTAADNNVYGEGLLDAYALVTAASSAQLGGVVVTATRGGQPLPGTKVTLTSDTVDRSARTDEHGTVQLGRVPAGEYTLTASFFGQRTRQQTITVAGDGTATLTVDLSESVPWHAVHGTVTDPAGRPVVGAQVSLVGETFPGFTTGADGTYTGLLPEADYEVQVTHGRWLARKTVPFTVDGDETLDVTLEAKTDAYGYAAGVADTAWVNGGSVLPLTGDRASRVVELPFPVTFYGTTYTGASVHTDGYLTFGTGATTSTGDNAALPALSVPAAAVHAFWDDLVLDNVSTVRTKTSGSTPNRQFVISWTRAALKSSPKSRLDFQIVLAENGTVTLQYRNLAQGATGATATVGIAEKPAGTALTYSANEAALDAGTAVTFRVPGTGVLRGTVRDANDRQPLADATVRIQAPGVPAPVTVTSDKDGFYQAEVPAGELSVTATSFGYDLPAETLTVAEASVVKHDIALRTPLLVSNKGAVTVTARAGGTRTATVSLTNRGDLDANWQAREIDSPTPPASAPGQVLGSFPLSGLFSGVGIGYRNGEVYVVDTYFTGKLQKFDRNGKLLGTGAVATGVSYTDMTYVADRDLMCATGFSITGGSPIECFDPDTLETKETIAGPWSGDNSYGLAYRASDDTFYIATYTPANTVIRHLAGFSHAQPGSVLGECTPTVPWVGGLALNEEHNVLWGLNNNNVGEAVWALDPNTCATLGSAPDPDADPVSGAGLDIDEHGDLWLVGQAVRSPGRAVAYHINGALPAYSDVPWVSVTNPNGQLAPGGKAEVGLTIDTTGLAPGVHAATVMVTSNAAKVGATPITVTVNVTPRG